MAQMVKNLPTVQETWFWSLGWKDPLEKGYILSTIKIKMMRVWRKIQIHVLTYVYFFSKLVCTRAQSLIIFSVYTHSPGNLIHIPDFYNLDDTEFMSRKCLSNLKLESKSHLISTQIPKKRQNSWAPKNWWFELWCWTRFLRVSWTARRSK